MNRSWLKANWHDGHYESLGYNEARKQMYGYIDNEDGLIRCVYTGFTQQGGYVTYPNPINAEHLVPQSFFNSDEPMKSDIYILKPCHGNASDSEEQLTIWGGLMTLKLSGMELWATPILHKGECRLTTSFGLKNLAEPGNPEKNIRAILQGQFSTSAPCTLVGSEITDLSTLETLYQWHLDDPVDAEELDRNDKVESQQEAEIHMSTIPTWFGMLGFRTGQ